jgi:cation-transporting ATPase 13A3/4/5
MVSWIFPPSIPIAIQIRGALTLARLATNKIIGRSIEKIQIAGKVNVVCFDKTGTLTNLGLDVKGQWIMKEKENKGIMNRIMATCHHITRVESDLFGDIVDVEMFKESKWDIDFGCKDCRF